MIWTNGAFFQQKKYNAHFYKGKTNLQVLHKLYPCEKKTLFNRLTKERIDKCSINLGYYGHKDNVYTVFL